MARGELVGARRFVVLVGLGLAACYGALGCRGRPEPVAGASAASASVAGASAASAVKSAAPKVSELEASPDCVVPDSAADCQAGFCRIEAGCFVIGAPRGEYGAARFADRQTEVRLTRAYLIGRTELTRAEWSREGVALPEAESEAGGPSCTSELCPVTNLNFFEAAAFANRYSERRKLEPCYRLSGCSGEIGKGLVCQGVQSRAASLYECRGYRLPTEAEWEYAARAKTRTAFYSGPIAARGDADCYAEPNLDAIGWFCANSGAAAHPVALKRPNAWGLYDTSGNVFEWCNDFKSVRGYGESRTSDPLWPLERNGDLTSVPDFSDRAARGGSYLSNAPGSTVSWRTGFPDATRAPNLGFRLVRSL